MSVDDRPDSKYLLCLFHYSVSVKTSVGATVTVSAVLAVQSMVLKRYSEGIHSGDAFCWLAHRAADASRGRHWRCQLTEPLKLISLLGGDTRKPTVPSCYVVDFSVFWHCQKHKQTKAWYTVPHFHILQDNHEVKKKSHGFKWHFLLIFYYLTCPYSAFVSTNGLWQMCPALLKERAYERDALHLPKYSIATFFQVN